MLFRPALILDGKLICTSCEDAADAAAWVLTAACFMNFMCCNLTVALMRGLAAAAEPAAVSPGCTPDMPPPRQIALDKKGLKTGSSVSACFRTLLGPLCIVCGAAMTHKWRHGLCPFSGPWCNLVLVPTTHMQ